MLLNNLKKEILRNNKKIERSPIKVTWRWQCDLMHFRLFKNCVAMVFGCNVVANSPSFLIYE